jgi:gliding motility-associated-like protein
MKKRLVLLFLGNILLFIPRDVYGDHGGGAELTYEWVRDSTYRFYFRFYRDCNGVIAPPSFDLCYTNDCGMSPRRVNLARVADPDNGTPVDPGCPNYPNRCLTTGSSLPGYQSWLYTGTVTLPARCDRWRFYVSVWARNPSGNINSNVNDQDLYIEAILNTRDAPGNSSPIFTVPPVPYICLNIPFTYNNGAMDPDGDSVVIRLIQPMGDNSFGSGRCDFANFPIPFRPTVPPYNLADNPLACGNSFQLDPHTGQMSYTPTVQQWAVLTIRADEYRNGHLIGSVMRDLQTIILPCNIQQPVLHKDTAGITGASWTNGRIEVCAGAEMIFCYNATSGGANPSLVLSDNSAAVLPGSSVQYTGQNTANVRGCVRWKPTALDTGLRVLTVSVRDVVCDAPGVVVTQTFSVPVLVRPGTMAFKDTAICRGASVPLLAAGGTQFTWDVLPGGSPLSSLSCTNCNNPTATPDRSTAYVVRSNLTNVYGCRNRDTVYVRIDTSNGVRISPESPLLLCAPDSVHLKALAYGRNHPINLSCGANNTPCNGFIDSITLTKPLMQATSGMDQSPFDGRYRTQRMQVLYQQQQLRRDAGMPPGTIRKIALHFGTGNPAVFEQVKIRMGCTNKQGFSSPTNWETGLTDVFTAASITIIPGWNEFALDHPYDWDTTKGLVLEFCYANTNLTQALPIYYLRSNYYSMISNYQISAGDACAQPVSGGGARLQAQPEIRFVYCEAPEQDFVYQWSPPTGLTNPGIANPSAFVSAPITYTVTTRGRNGCLLQDSIEIIFGAPDFSVTPARDTICLGDRLQFRIQGAVRADWYEKDFQFPASLSCSECSAPWAAPLRHTIYQVVAENVEGCLDTLEAEIFVKPRPEIAVLEEDTLVIYGMPIALHATGGVRYRWSPAETLDDPGSATPIARPTAPAYYIVTGYGANGCAGKDSVFIDVDFRGRTFVPSAFSPNGDGINDVFRVANLTFQSVEAFLVFNRWGQEIFSTQDPTKGWDGTWNGEPQEIGVYHYLIRLRFPDGTTQMYKGDVTLVR